MSSTNKKSKYHSFFSKKRTPSRSPSDPGGRTNAPKKQHLDVTKVQKDFTPMEVNELLKDDANISGNNLSEDVVAEIASNHTETGTYAEAASKKKIVYQHLTYLQKGQQRREPITKALFLTFMSSLQSIMWKMPKLEFDCINIDWSDHHLGRGLIACMDESSSRFVKKQAEVFNFEGQTVRAWLKDEFGTTNSYQTFLHNEVWIDIRGPQALGWILEKNGLLNKGKFQVISYKKQKKGVFMRFEADDELAKAIDGHGHSLRAGICRVVLKKKVITNKVAVIESVDSAKDAETPAAESAVISSEITATKPQS